LNDARVGVLAIAIAIHNIPEGLCVQCPFTMLPATAKSLCQSVFVGCLNPALLDVCEFLPMTCGCVVLFDSWRVWLIQVMRATTDGSSADPEDTVVTNCCSW
jgi:hypothetical protein